MRPLVLGLLILLTGPAVATAAPCALRPGERIVARSSDLTVTRTGDRFTACIRATGVRRRISRGFGRVGAVAGPYVVHAGRRHTNPALLLRDVPTGESTVLEPSGERVEAVRLDARGRVGWRTGTGRLRALEPARRPRTVARGPSLGGVRLRAGTLRWRQAGRVRRIRLAGPTCALRSGARAVLTTPRLVVSERTTRTTYPADPEESSTVTPLWSCLPGDGRQRLLGTAESGFGYFRDLTAFTPSGPLLAYEVRSFTKGQGSTDAVVVRDLRSLETVGALGALYDGTIVLAGFDDRGRTLAVTRTSRIGDRGEIAEVVALSSAGERVVLDPAGAGEITEPALAPDGTATWRRAGEPRSARVP